MKEEKKLYQNIETEIGKRNIESIPIPSYISDNLKHTFFDWQKKALQYFLTYQEPKNDFTHSPSHLMFNMATGTGKTLLMAAMILYYYKEKGMRNFLFFVNQNNIVDKTENNFINNAHKKYLFKDKIIIDDQSINIKKVDIFTDNQNQDIEIKFITIQKLYNEIHSARENQTTLSDLHQKNIVMLADEGHHLNANTKKKKLEMDFKYELKSNTSKEEVEKKGWEDTVINLMLKKKNQKEIDNKNVLLEFTATLPQSAQVVEKYNDKIIYQFGLKEFLQAGYTKEINLISSTWDKKERILYALLFQWYRHEIAVRNKILNFKPVILFRSKTIEESKKDYNDFLEWQQEVKGDDFDFIKTIKNTSHQPNLNSNPNEMGQSRTEQILNFIESKKISFNDIAEFIKNNFSEKNIIITNSKSNKTQKEKTTTEQEKLLNSLEDKNNHIRAIFTVDRLTEGWDVLNLFDIVRLYQGQNTGGSTNRTPEATTKEKQLIGRGVRYYPFNFDEKPINKRKFDDDMNHELRVLEELYYHTYDEDSKYISHLKTELKKDGYIRDDKIVKKFSLKNQFKESDFYQTTKIWYNKKINNPNRRKQSLSDIILNESLKYKINDIELHEEEVKLNKDGITSQKLNIVNRDSKTSTIRFNEIEKHIFRKAIHIKAKQENSLYQFSQLKEELEITSLDDLREDDFLGNFEIKIITTSNQSYKDLGEKDKLKITLQALGKIFTELKECIIPKIGSKKFYSSSFEKIFGEGKEKTINKDNEKKGIPNNNWYVLDQFVGTSEEENLVNFIRESIGNLEKEYNEVYLLKNEEIYKIYDFERGRGFQPDFILFLKQNKENLYYQIFIEPKGNQFKDSTGSFKSSKEGWKENFLDEIQKEYGAEFKLKIENKNYKLIGLPFFNEDNKKLFQENFGKLI